MPKIIMHIRKLTLLVLALIVFGITACIMSIQSFESLTPSAGIFQATRSSPYTGNSKNSTSAVDNLKYDDYRIVTLLPKDAIPAIDNPSFLTSEEADDEYAPDEYVIGVMFNGDARAYSISYLSSHEIVNDNVGGKKIAVTW